ncbi:nitroreductase/quinone reductase family protein [Herbiconiux solani]|uniref:nitroreductase/quinone reductase family protein n=1 Tax=Herbiconiux solani TaxID=661329 RepID=UPI0008271FA4|nr:nitroreductase/quinone reductase family protein [Herbiconiux solani]
MSDFNQRVVDEFRANGWVETGGFGSDIVLLHTTGAKTGEPRMSPVMAIRRGESWIVVASKAGAPENPAWYANLRAHPDAVIEAADDQGQVSEVAVTAVDLHGAEYAEAWAAVVARAPGFEGYRERTDGIRTIPVLRLDRR